MLLWVRQEYTAGLTKGYHSENIDFRHWIPKVNQQLIFEGINLVRPN
jgi:hypothetical protein